LTSRSGNFRISAWTSGETGVALTMQAFEMGLPGSWGQWLVTLGVITFAFSTILGWSYYGERCAEFVFGVHAILPYRICWIAVIMVGALIHKISIVWNFSDLLNGLMAIPNLIALLLLSPVVFALTREYRRNGDG